MTKMTTEEFLCRKIVTSLKTIIGDFEIGGNWIASEDLKGVPSAAGKKIAVNINERSYYNEQSKVAILFYEIKATVRPEEDETGIETIETYRKVAKLLMSWHNNFQKAKDALSEAKFNLVGFWLASAIFKIEQGTIDRTFQIKGVIKGIEHELD